MQAEMHRVSRLIAQSVRKDVVPLLDAVNVKKIESIKKAPT